VRQLFDGRGELLQCLTTRLHPGLKVWPVSRRQLVVSESVLQRPNDVLIRRLGWNTMQTVSSLALQDTQKVSGLLSGRPVVVDSRSFKLTMKHEPRCGSIELRRFNFVGVAPALPPPARLVRASR
jgi:hypothetical protein